MAGSTRGRMDKDEYNRLKTVHCLQCGYSGVKGAQYRRYGGLKGEKQGLEHTQIPPELSNFGQWNCCSQPKSTLGLLSLVQEYRVGSGQTDAYSTGSK